MGFHRLKTPCEPFQRLYVCEVCRRDQFICMAIAWDLQSKSSIQVSTSDCRYKSRRIRLWASEICTLSDMRWDLSFWWHTDQPVCAYQTLESTGLWLLATCYAVCITAGIFNMNSFVRLSSSHVEFLISGQREDDRQWWFSWWYSEPITEI